MGAPADNDHRDITGHAEELRVETETVETGAVRIHKGVTTTETSASAARRSEEFGTIERVAANADDSGQIEELEDGSISIPILEEQLVVTKRVVVRERVIVRKRVRIVQQRIETELRSEHVSIETDDQRSA